MQGGFPKEIENEISIFLKKENRALASTFEDEVFLTQLAYLCDIFFLIKSIKHLLPRKRNSPSTTS